jgi:hypothetical protein
MDWSKEKHGTMTVHSSLKNVTKVIKNKNALLPREEEAPIRNIHSEALSRLSALSCMNSESQHYLFLKASYYRL